MDSLKGSHTPKPGEKKQEKDFVNLLDFSELDRTPEPTTPITPLDRAEKELRRLELEFGSKYLQVIGVLIISVAFSILGYYPTSAMPITGQVLFMFLGAGVLLLAGDILIRGKEMRYYALGLIFAGIKLIYSSFWALFYNFDLIDESLFLAAVILTLGFHYFASVRYRSTVLNASFVPLSFAPLVILRDIYSLDNITIILFLMIIGVNYFQAHLRKEATAIMTVPASAAIYLHLNAGKMSIYDFTFSLDPSEWVLTSFLLVYSTLTLLFLFLHYNDKTLLSDYLHDLPGTTFAHLTTFFLLISILACYPFCSIPVFLFLISLTFSGLIVVHFHVRGEGLFTVSSPLISALTLSLSPFIALNLGEAFLLPTAISILVVVESALYFSGKPRTLNRLQRQVIMA
ncbi:MAG: hypothetical protein KAU14_07445, partial [Thermoplasmata archaeon]|nr:hypothetical protein [Thermoplasmata archaeon]